jgi:ankyrin repeat protein
VKDIGSSYPNPMCWTPFVDLAKKRRFKKIMTILENRDPVAVSQWLPNPASSLGQTPLHFLLQFRPPLDLVEQLIAILGQGFVPEDAVDAQGKTPLHIAVIAGCDSAVVQRLTYGKEKIISAVRTKDHLERSPLHWACDSPGAVPGCFGIVGKNDPDVEEIVSVLARAFPEAVRMRDVHGTTPMDLALQNQANDRIMELLKAEFLPKHEDREYSFSSETDDASTMMPGEIATSWIDDLSSLGTGGVTTLYGRSKSFKKRIKFARMSYEI